MYRWCARLGAFFFFVKPLNFVFAYLFLCAMWYFRAACSLSLHWFTTYNFTLNMPEIGLACKYTDRVYSEPKLSTTKNCCLFAEVTNSLFSRYVNIRTEAYGTQLLEINYGFPRCAPEGIEAVHRHGTFKRSRVKAHSLQLCFFGF